MNADATWNSRAARPPRATRAAWLIAGSLVALAAIPYGTFSLVDVLALDRERAHFEFAEPVAALEVRSAGGSVEVVGVESGPVVVDFAIRRGLFEPKPSARIEEARLVVKGDCPHFFGGVCNVAITVRVPRGVSLDLHASGGSIRGRNLFNGVAEASSSGGSVNLSFAGPVERVRASSSGGGVRLTFAAEAASVNASASGGGVRLTFAVPPGKVKAESSGGGVTVVLPRTEDLYAVDASSSGGGTRTDVRTDPLSPRVVDVHSSGGGVTVRYPEP